MIVYYIWNVLSLGLIYAVRVAIRKSLVEANIETVNRWNKVTEARSAFVETLRQGDAIGDSRT